MWRESFDRIRHVLEAGEKVYQDLITVREPDMDIIVCPGHMGDTIWIAALAGEYIRQNDCDGVYYTVKSSQSDLVMRFPDVAGTIVLEDSELSCLCLYITVMNYWKHDHITYANFRGDYVLRGYGACLVQGSSLPEGASMLDMRKEMLGLTGDVHCSRILQIGEGDNAELAELFNKAVLLMPVSQSLETLPMSFWEMLAKEYTGRGYDVYTNYNGFDYEIMIEGTKPLTSTPLELTEIGPYFAQVVAMRSGACDLLAGTDSNLAIVYDTRFPDKEVELTRKELPMENIFDLVDRERIYNYQYLDGREVELAEAIIRKI